MSLERYTGSSLSNRNHDLWSDFIFAPFAVSRQASQGAASLPGLRALAPRRGCRSLQGVRLAA